MKTLGMTTVFALILTVSLFAQDRTPRADRREIGQRVRIMDGRRSGEINGGEARHLNRQQHHIRRTVRRVKADGKVTRIERRRLHHQQSRASRNIRKAKHNSF